MFLVSGSVRVFTGPTACFSNSPCPNDVRSSKTYPVFCVLSVRLSRFHHPTEGNGGEMLKQGKILDKVLLRKGHAQKFFVNGPKYAKFGRF